MKKRDEFIKKAQKIHNSFYDYHKVIYTNAKTKVELICPIHGSFLQTPSHHLAGHGCQDCGRLKSNKAKSHSYKYVKQYFTKQGSKLLSDTYKNNRQKLLFICKCGQKEEMVFGKFNVTRMCKRNVPIKKD